MNKNYLQFSYYLIFSLILTIVGAAIGSQIGAQYSITYLVLSLALVILFMFVKGTFKKIVFTIFCIGEGIVLAPIIKYYSEADLTGCLILTLLITVIMLIVGYKTKDLGFIGNTLIMLLSGLVFYKILGIFFNLPSIALLGVLLFSAYIAYDINMFKRDSISRNMTSDDILNHVMNLYLDILNLFIQLLELIGKDDK